MGGKFARRFTRHRKNGIRDCGEFLDSMTANVRPDKRSETHQNHGVQDCRSRVHAVLAGRARPARQPGRAGFARPCLPRFTARPSGRNARRAGSKTMDRGRLHAAAIDTFSRATMTRSEPRAAIGKLMKTVAKGFEIGHGRHGRPGSDRHSLRPIHVTRQLLRLEALRPGAPATRPPSILKARSWRLAARVDWSIE